VPTLCRRSQIAANYTSRTLKLMSERSCHFYLIAFFNSRYYVADIFYLGEARILFENDARIARLLTDCNVSVWNIAFHHPNKSRFIN